MPRTGRNKSKTKIYHLILRGINKQTIFEDDEDRIKLIQTIQECKYRSSLELYAYCLMSNHIHLLLKEGKEDLGITMRRLGAMYVYWYNWKYDRCGHLFQDIATVTLWHNGAVNALTTTITSSTTTPVVKNIVSKGTDEDKITLTEAQFAALATKDVVKFDSTGAAGTLADFYFEVEDSYGKKALIPTQFKVDVKNAAETGAGKAALTISPTGEITAATAEKGDHVYVTAVTNNGMVKTVKVTIIP
jgi:REP element-mobilizing transposase RayT